MIGLSNFSTDPASPLLDLLPRRLAHPRTLPDRNLAPTIFPLLLLGHIRHLGLLDHSLDSVRRILLHILGLDLDHPGLPTVLNSILRVARKALGVQIWKEEYFCPCAGNQKCPPFHLREP